MRGSCSIFGFQGPDVPLAVLRVVNSELSFINILHVKTKCNIKNNKNENKLKKSENKY